MAQKFKLLFALWLVAACLVSGSTAQTTDFEPTANSTAGNTTSSPMSTISTPSADACGDNPCPFGSTCENRANNSRVCLCMAGDFYNSEDNTCGNAKIFPGKLNVDLEYKTQMGDNTSFLFLETAILISDTLKGIFTGEKSGYLGSIVLNIEPQNSIKMWSRSGTKIIATVEISFSSSADITTANVMEAISNVNEGILADSNFTVTDLCGRGPCDPVTTTCEVKDGLFKCSCQHQYITSPFSDTVCTACPSGEQPADENTCVPCPLGYTGLACSDSWQLALIIVGVVGGVLLITVIILSVLVSKSKKSSKKNAKMETKQPHVGHASIQAPLVNSSFANSHAAPPNTPANGFVKSGMPKIPRATANSNWDTNDLEMNRNYSRPNPAPVGRNTRFNQEQDNMNPYTQTRPMNPYDRAMPQINPYASSQGHSNPHYIHDNGRRVH